MSRRLHKGLLLAAIAAAILPAGGSAAFSPAQLLASITGAARGDPSSSTHTGKALLYARSTGSQLPVAELSTDHKAHSAVSFGGWNDPIRLSSPPASVPIAKTGLE